MFTLGTSTLIERTCTWKGWTRRNRTCWTFIHGRITSGPYMFSLEILVRTPSGPIASRGRCYDALWTTLMAKYFIKTPLTEFSGSVRVYKLMTKNTDYSWFKHILFILCFTISKAQIIKQSSWIEGIWQRVLLELTKYLCIQMRERERENVWLTSCFRQVTLELMSSCLSGLPTLI